MVALRLFVLVETVFDFDFDFTMSLELRLTQLEGQNHNLSNDIQLIKEQLELTWPITCDIYLSHLIKGAS